MRQWFLLAACAACATAAQAGSLSCTATTLTYEPAQPFPYDSIVARVQLTAPSAGGQWLDSLPAMVGGRATVTGGRIVVDIYGGDVVLPLAIPVLRTFSPAARSEPATLTVGPLAPGRYDLSLRVHNLDAIGVDTPCFERPAQPQTVSVRAREGPVEVIEAVEYYNKDLDHYFVTAAVAEITDLDSGRHRGWQRTGGTFAVFAAGKSGGAGTPVCRFYGLPSAGLDSHFYTADAEECAQIETRFNGAWQLETTNAFEIVLPNAAAPYCDSGTRPILRFWNQRTDSNHRFTTDQTVLPGMLQLGYVIEGLGVPTPVSMCSPR